MSRKYWFREILVLLRETVYCGLQALRPQSTGNERPKGLLLVRPARTARIGPEGSSPLPDAAEASPQGSRLLAALPDGEFTPQDVTPFLP